MSLCPVASTSPAHSSCTPCLDRRMGGREGGSEAGAGPEGLRMGSPVLWLYPFPAGSCHHPWSLKVSQCSAASLSNCIFLPDKRGAGSALVPTDRQAVSYSGICSRQKGEEGREISHSPPTGGWGENLALGRPSQHPQEMPRGQPRPEWTWVPHQCSLA